MTLESDDIEIAESTSREQVAAEGQSTATTKPPIDADPSGSATLARWDAALVGVFAFGLSAIGLSRPWLWGDEAATISMANRSLPDLWATLERRDNVHGLYYMFMHFWYQLFGVTEFTSRLPSAIAVGIAAAGVVVLGKQLSTRTVAVTAGIVFAVLPRVTSVGIEARVYGLTMALAVWLTVLCLKAVRGEKLRASVWPVYGAVLSISILTNLFIALILPAHAVAVRMSSRSKETLLRWTITTAVSVGAVSPFLIAAASQSKYFFKWIAPLSAATVPSLWKQQYFGWEPKNFTTMLALLASGLLLAALLISVRSGTRQPGTLVAVTLAWIVFPTVALLAYSAFVSPLYNVRYLSFTAPGFALLLGYCMVKVGAAYLSLFVSDGRPKRSRAVIIAILVGFALLSAPAYLSQRAPEAYGKDSLDYQQVGDVIDRNAADGDCLVVDDTKNPKRWWSLRWLLVPRPAPFEKLVEPAFASTAAQNRELLGTARPIPDVAAKLRGCQVIWTISSKDVGLPPHERGPALLPGPQLKQTKAYEVESEAGFRIVERWQFASSQVTKSTH